MPGTWNCRMPRKKSPVKPPGIDPGTFRLVASTTPPQARMTWEGNEKCIQQDNVPINVTLRRVCVTTIAMEKQYVPYYLLTMRVYAALVIQHAKRKHLTILTTVAFLDLPYFSTLSHKRHGFRKISNGHKMYVLISSRNFV
jgi:hypothetical protein